MNLNFLSLPFLPPLSPPTASLTLSLMEETPFSPTSLMFSIPALSPAVGAESPLAMFSTVLAATPAPEPDILLLRPSSRSVTTETPRSAIADTKPCICSPSRFNPSWLVMESAALPSPDLVPASPSLVFAAIFSPSFDRLVRHCVDAAGIELPVLRAPHPQTRHRLLGRLALGFLRPLLLRTRLRALGFLRPLLLRIRLLALGFLRPLLLRTRLRALGFLRPLLLRTRLRALGSLRPL